MDIIKYLKQKTDELLILFKKDKTTITTVTDDSSIKKSDDYTKLDFDEEAHY